MFNTQFQKIITPIKCFSFISNQFIISLVVVLSVLCISLNGCGKYLTGNPRNIDIKPNDKLVFGKIVVYNKRYNKDEVELIGRNIFACFDLIDIVTGKKNGHECGYINVGSLASVRSEDKPYYGFVMLSLPPGNANLSFLRVDNYCLGGSLSFEFQDSMVFKVSETSNATYFGSISFHIIEDMPFVPTKYQKVYFPKLSVVVKNEGDRVLNKLNGLSSELTKNYTSSTIQAEKGKYSVVYRGKK